MGFCRRCGNIVAGVRCECGGTAVAPVIAWNRTDTKDLSRDRWSKTYTSSDQPSSATSATPVAESSEVSSSVAPPRRFARPRPVSAITLKAGVSDHITTMTSKSQAPPSPLKQCFNHSRVESDIIHSLGSHEPTLSKVYGSILQPKDSLQLHSCAICASVFSPDTTIYPNPTCSPSEPPTFLCRTCFSANGGSKGICPTCGKAVLALKAEGAFIQAGGQYWHKRCFNCAGCFQNIGDSPLVDLFGHPSCEACFDNCLKRDPSTPKKERVTPQTSPIHNSLGGINHNYGRKSRESSPMIEELEHRLKSSKSRDSISVAHPSPSSRYNSSTPINNVSTPTLTATPQSRRLSDSNTLSNRGSPSKDPDLLNLWQKVESSPSRVSQSASRGESPPRAKEWDVFGPSNKDQTSDIAAEDINGSSASRSPQTASATATLSGNVSPSSVCAKCKNAIMKPRERGQFMTVPALDENSLPEVYHLDCFKCAICDQTLTEVKKGQLGFVRSASGPCHSHCAPKESVVVRKTITPNIVPKSIPASSSVKITPLITSTKSSTSLLSSSSRYETPLAPPSASPTKSSYPRFGGQGTCPGCRKAVSPMERGVVPGPQGTRWHASCLICGGRKETTAARLLGRDKKSEPGCGKKLDSAAKTDGDGGVWCRECLLLIGIGGSPQTSPTRPPLVPSHTGTEHIKIAPQLTGMTTIVRQFTGASAAESALRQLGGGGGLSPTRSISPTKQLGMGMGASGTVFVRPRPKSVIGMRSKSIDEGRGMFLVRQMTGDSKF